MKATIIQDVISSMKGREVYGKRGDIVTVIDDRGTVSIVEGPRWIQDESDKKKTALIKAGTHRYPAATDKLKF